MFFCAAYGTISLIGAPRTARNTFKTERKRGNAVKRGGGETVRLYKVLPRIEAAADQGLRGEEAHERLCNGYANKSPESAEKTVGQIIKDNVLTYFNMIFFLLALCVILVGSYNNLTFLPIVFANMGIGIIQELRSKRALSRLTFVAAPSAVVVRDGALVTIPAEEAVLDDVAVFSGGMQIYADAIVLTGECNVNEALVTGEADEIVKRPGDTLLSGSFIVSGECRARLNKVGRDSFVAQLTLEAKKTGKKQRSEMMAALTRLVKVIGILIIPLGITMFLQQTRVLDRTVQEGVVSTVAALIGMIPEGLYLLVSVALTVSVMRLAKRRTLVQELGCIETLARVDVLCVDKTGTITESKMAARGLVPLCPDRFNEDDLQMILTDYAGNVGPENETMAALGELYSGKPSRRAVKILPFTSVNKYSGVSFNRDESYLLGAPEKILLDDYEPYREVIEAHSAQGYRVLLLALYDGDIGAKGIHGDVMPLALALLSNNIRPEAPDTFRFFARQGVAIKVISGDNPVTVAKVAAEAGIEGAERYVDASTLKTERQLTRATREYTVFGRVSPDQKRRLVRAFKKAGHTVAMTGDGVNDVLALKDADCSIAMASGSDVACQIAQIVLMDSNFAAMPAVVMEGRRVINNIERSASLFLVKNIFSFLLTILTLIFTLTYPLTPSQLSLFNIMFIGIPSFVFALEPNTAMVRGRFLRNVLLNAFPAGITDLLAVLATVVVCTRLGIPAEEMTTSAAILLAFVGLMMLLKTGSPLNLLRRVLIVAMVIGFAGGALLLGPLFTMAPLSGEAVLVTAVIAAAAVPVMLVLTIFTRGLSRRLNQRR